MNTLFDVKATVRSLVGDDVGEWTNDGYLVPKINLAYRTQYLYIKRGCGSSLEKIVEIPNAPDVNNNDANTGLTSLAAQQQPGKLLSGLYEPLYMWWKPAGTPDSYYNEVFEKKTLPFSLPVSCNPSAAMYFTWRGNQLFITPINAPIDILVDGRFNPPPLVKDQDVLVADIDMETTVSPATLAIVGVECGNPNYQSTGQAMAESAADDIVAKIIRGKQGYTARAGSNSRRNRRGWFWF